MIYLTYNRFAGESHLNQELLSFAPVIRWTKAVAHHDHLEIRYLLSVHCLKVLYQLSGMNKRARQHCLSF